MAKTAIRTANLADTELEKALDAALSKNEMWRRFNQQSFNCFPVALCVAVVLMQIGFEPRVIHAVVTSNGKTFNHAWVEIELNTIKNNPDSKLAYVVDYANGQKIIIPAVSYYEAAAVTPKSVEDYSVDEIMKLSFSKAKHYGPYTPTERSMNPKTAIRTDETLWRKIVQKVKAGDKGGKAGQWSARKAQIAVALYKEAGGEYVGKKTADNSLSKWTRQKWRTKSGKPSLETGERYLPEAAIEALTDEEYRETSSAKRAGMRRGEQFVAQPEEIAAKTAKYRRKNPTVSDLPVLAAAVGEKLHNRGYATSLPVEQKGGVCLYSYTKTYGVPVVILFESDNDKMISMSFYRDTELAADFEQVHGYSYFFDENAEGGIFEVVSRFNDEIKNICKNTMSVMDCLDVAGEDYFDLEENYEE